MTYQHLDISIRVQDFNLLVNRPEIMSRLRELTIRSYSGMNFELNHLIKKTSFRRVDAKVISAYNQDTMIAWALMSRESSSFVFPETRTNFDGSKGWLFEVYVQEKYRRHGVGSELLKVARRKSHGTKLFVCPHDRASRSFYDHYKHFNYEPL